MRFGAILGLGFLSLSSPCAMAADQNPQELVRKVIEAAGGEAKLLNVFRFRERVLITNTPAAPVTKDEKGNRTSVVQAGGEWWLGSRKRNKDKVRVLLWAWSLRILRDDKSKIETVPDIQVADKPAFGLHVTGSVNNPITLYFDKTTARLNAIDYDDTRHVFSEWKKTEQGHKYASHAVGYRFADRKSGTLQAQQWYQTDILELTPLKEFPAELKQ